MKLQWSIQSSHTQLVLSQVEYLNYRNEHIWPPTRKWLQIFEALHLASLQFITFYHFWTNTSHFEINACNFLYFNIVNKPWAFWMPYISIQVASLFPNQILVCAAAFAARYLFSFWDLHLLSSLSKNIKNRVGRYIGTSLCIHQNQRDYWPIVLDKLEDQFTTVTHRF